MLCIRSKGSSTRSVAVHFRGLFSCTRCHASTQQSMRRAAGGIQGPDHKWGVLLRRHGVTVKVLQVSEPLQCLACNEARPLSEAQVALNGVWCLRARASCASRYCLSGTCSASYADLVRSIQVPHDASGNKAPCTSCPRPVPTYKQQTGMPKLQQSGVRGRTRTPDQTRGTFQNCAGCSRIDWHKSSQSICGPYCRCLQDGSPQLAQVQAATVGEQWELQSRREDAKTAAKWSATHSRVHQATSPKPRQLDKAWLESHNLHVYGCSQALPTKGLGPATCGPCTAILRTAQMPAVAAYQAWHFASIVCQACLVLHAHLMPSNTACHVQYACCALALDAVDS